MGMLMHLAGMGLWCMVMVHSQMWLARALTDCILLLALLLLLLLTSASLMRIPLILQVWVCGVW